MSEVEGDLVDTWFDGGELEVKSFQPFRSGGTPAVLNWLGGKHWVCHRQVGLSACEKA